MIFKIKNRLLSDKGLLDLVSGGAISLFMQCSGLLAGYILMALIANYFGVRVLGIYSFAYAALTLLVVFSTLGLDIVILRIAAKDEGQSSIAILKKIYLIVVPWALILTCGSIIAAYFYSASIFDEVEYRKYLIIFGVSILFSVILAINIEYLRSNGNIAISEFLRNLVRPLISLFLVVMTCFFYYDIYIPAYMMLASVILACAMSIYYIFWRNSNDKNIPSKYNLSETTASLIKSGLPMQASTLLFYMISNMIIFFVKGYEDSVMVGLILVSIKLAAIINMPLMVLNKVCAPRFSKLYFANEHDELQKYLTQVTKLAFYVSAIAAIFLVIFSEFALSIFGDDFVHAKKIFFILVLGQIVSCASGSVGIFMMMTGNEKAYQNIAAVIAILSFIAYYLIMPKYGVIGAVCVLAGSQAALNMVSVFYIKYRLGFITMYIPFLPQTFCRNP